MSKTIDERVVEMRFDNKQFEDNVQTSLSTLDKLKKGLDLSGASKGLESVGTAAKNVNMSGLGSAVETVRARFSALQVVAMTALANITNSVVNTGKQMLNSLTIQPITQGLSEYELKMGSVQTIMASTGESLGTVNKYLQELNEYADKTIYSFSDMTSSIGKFTNAGVSLDSAVAAIKGVSNEAAVSGANTNEASRAMYNFAQALSAGYVKLIDWKSIENANMATVEFKQQLIETAVAMGTLVEKNGKYISTTTDANGKVSEAFTATSMFNDSLSAQWMTTDVLVQTLGNYATDIREMSAAEVESYEAKLRSIGYTEEQIEKVEKLGQKAADAATEVKTFHQLMDTLAEAAGSGWAETWEIIFGDFNEAKELWTEVSNAVGGFIDSMSDARNELLTGGLASGWKQFIKNRISDSEDFSNRIQESASNSEAAYSSMYESVEKKADAYNRALSTGNEFQLEQLGLTRDQASEYNKLKQQVDSGAISQAEFFNQAIELAGGFEKSLKEGWASAEVLGEGIEDVAAKTRQLANDKRAEYDAVKDLSVAQLESMGMTVEEVECLRKEAEALENSANEYEELNKQVQNGTIDLEEYSKKMMILSGRENLIIAFKNAFSALGSILKPIGEAFREIFPAMTAERLYKLTENLKDFTSRLKLSDKASANLKSTFKGLFAVLDIVKQAFSAVFNAVKPLFGGITDLAGGILGLTGGFGNWLVGVDEAIKKNDTFGKAIQGVISFVEGLISTIKDFASQIREKFNLPSFDEIKESVSGLFAVLGEKIKTPGLEALGSLVDNIKERFAQLKEGAGTVKTAISGFIDEVANKINSSTLLQMLQSLWNGVKTIASGITTVLSNLVKGLGSAFGSGGFNGVLDLLNGLSFAGITVAINKFVHGITSPFEKAGGILGSIKGILTGVKDTLKSYQESLKAGTLIKIATAIAILAGSILVIAMIDSDKLNSSLGAITVMFADLMGSLAIFSKFSGDLKGATKAVALMIGIATSVLILASALKKIGSLDIGQLATGMVGIAGLMAMMVAAMKVLSSGNKNMVKGAAGMIAFAAAIRIIVPALKSLSGLGWEQLGKGLVGIGALIAEFAIGLKAMKGTTGGAASMLIAADALLVLVPVLLTLGQMSWEKIAKGLVAIGGALLELALALNAMKGTAGGAASLLIAADALLLLIPALAAMGSLSLETILKGLIAIGGALLELSIALNVMKGTLGGSAALLVAAAALLVLTPALVILGKMSWESIAKGLVALAGAFAVMGVAGLVLGPLVPVILGLAGAFTLIGVGVVALGTGLSLVGVGLMAIGAGFTAIATAGAAGATAVVAALTVIITGVAALIPEVLTQVGNGIIALCDVIAEGAPAIGEAVKAVVLSLIDVLVECVPQIANGALELVAGVLAALVTYTPQIVDSIFGFLISLLEGVAANLPALIAAAVDVIAAFFSGIIDALSGIDTDTLIKTIAGVGLLAAIIAGIGLITPLIPSAMAGVLGMGVVIAELAVVLAAIGALAQISGLSWLINEGGQLLEGIGNAIGSLIGGLIGGIMGGISAQLPQMGTDLSNFMTNITPFIEGASKIDASMMEGVQALAGAILALTAANVLDGLTSWLTGGSSITEFGAELAAFGPYFSQYYESVKNVDGGVVSASASAASAMAEFASNIPNSGGLVAKITGDNSLSQFAAELALFGPSFALYAKSVEGIDADSVANSATAASAIAEFAAGLPNTGGLVSLVTGDNSLSGFAAELAAFGPELKNYADSVEGIDVASVQNSVDAAAALIEVAGTIQNSGGIISWFTGDNDLATFGESLISFGKNFAAYSDAVANVDTVQISLTTVALASLITFQEAHPDASGLEDLGDNIADFGSSLGDFWADVGTIDAGILSSVIDQTNRLVSMITGMAGLDASGATAFSDALSTLGSTSVDEFINAFTNAADRVQTAASNMMTTFITAAEAKKSDATSTFTTIVEAIITTIDGKKQSFNTEGQTLMTQFISGLESKKTSLSNSVIVIVGIALTQIRNKYSEFSSAGQMTMTKFANGISSNSRAASNSAGSVASSAASAARGYYTTFYNAGYYLVTGFANGISANTYAAQAKARAMANAAANAARNALAVRSPSRVGYEIGDYFGIGFVNAIGDSESRAYRSGFAFAISAKDGLAKAVSTISDMSFDSLDIRPTVTPVLDLSNIQNGAKMLYSMVGGLNQYQLGGSFNIAAQMQMNIDAQRATPVDDTTAIAIDDLKKAIEDLVRNPPAHNDNTFNITSDDPEEIAEYVSSRIQRDVERRAAVWG